MKVEFQLPPSSELESSLTVWQRALSSAVSDGDDEHADNPTAAAMAMDVAILVVARMRCLPDVAVVAAHGPARPRRCTGNPRHTAATPPGPHRDVTPGAPPPSLLA